MASVGVDIVEIRRIEAAVNRSSGRFLRRVYTETELKTCHGRFPSLASRFAAKEAVMKVLGSGGAGIAWREIEILRLIAEGLTNRDISERLCLSENTVKSYIQDLYQKLDAHNRIEAVMRATRWGLL